MKWWKGGQDGRVASSPRCLLAASSAAASTQLQPVVTHSEFWKQWGEKKSPYLKSVQVVSSTGIPGKIHPLASEQLLLLSDDTISTM